MVAGRVRENAALLRFRIERRDLVVRTTKLECAPALEALRLHEDRCGDEAVQRAGSQHRRAVGDAVEPRRRSLDVVERDHHGKGTVWSVRSYRVVLMGRVGLRAASASISLSAP